MSQTEKIKPKFFLGNVFCNLVKMDFIKVVSKKVSLGTGIETEVSKLAPD